MKTSRQMKTNHQNKAVYLLDQIARGYIPVQYRAVFQKLLIHGDKSLLRAIIFNELLEGGELKPSTKACRMLNTSRSSLYRDFNKHKPIFKKGKTCHR